MAKRGFLDGYSTYDTSQGHGDPAQWRGAFGERMTFEEAQEAIGSDAPYSILGVPLDAPWLVVKQAYRKLAQQFHPDIYFGADREERFKKINGAYRVLMEQYGELPKQS